MPDIDKDRELLRQTVIELQRRGVDVEWHHSGGSIMVIRYKDTARNLELIFSNQDETWGLDISTLEPWSYEEDSETYVNLPWDATPDRVADVIQARLAQAVVRDGQHRTVVVLDEIYGIGFAEETGTAAGLEASRGGVMEERIKKALEYAIQYGGIDGAHHKDWVIDQMVRALTGCPSTQVTAKDSRGEAYTYETQGESDEYRRLVRTSTDADGEWSTGIAP